MHDFVEGAFTVKNLIGIPSRHFDPIFAQVAARALATFKPSIVALELPDGLIGELEWASACWPGPVVVASENALFPFVPGDSMFEAFRLANVDRIPVILVDLPVAGPNPAASIRQVNSGLLGSELTRAGPGLFLEASDLLDSPLTTSERWHDAREAHMARQLTQLLAQGETVMWVGGMAHWTRIVARINEGSFDAPSVDLTDYSSFKRMRLAPSALYRMTARLPWLVAHYARDPSTYDEHLAIQTLCLEATRKPGKETTILVLSGRSEDKAVDEAEPSSPIDVARTLQYARNLAATGSLRERPTFGELLTAAVATIGPKYGGSVYELAMNEQASALALEHDAIEWDVVDGRERYRCGDRIIEERPWQAPLGRRLLSGKEIHRHAHDEFYKDLPPAKSADAERQWECSPNDEDDYTSFVEYVLRRASYTDPDEPKTAPFQVGLRDGLDVRATLRNWSKGTIYVREEQRGRMNFSNGAIDWVNASEHSDELSGKVSAGWSDPDFTRVGSCSRTVEAFDLLEADPLVQRDYRNFTLISLDAPTSRPGSRRSSPSFYDRVISPLVDLDVLRKRKSNLYEWLEIMFKFCAGKPFAYYSRYVPSPEIHRVAWRFKVHVVHFPLQRLPARQLDRHKTFRWFALTREQWEEFQRRRSAGAATWPG